MQQKNKQIKLLVFCAIAAFFIYVTGLTVRADSFTDKGDNDTMETAETLRQMMRHPAVHFRDQSQGKFK